MPTLKKIPGKLTIGEAFERLERNPNDPDPELQKFKQDLAKSIAPLGKELNIALVASVQKMVSDYNRNFAVAISEAIKPNLSIAFTLNEVIKPSFAFIQLMNEVAETQRRFIESIQMPNYLFESIRNLSEQINNQIYEPIRLLSQSFAMYRTPNLFNELTAINTSWIVPGYVPMGPIKDGNKYEQTLKEETEILGQEIDSLVQNQFQIVNTPYYYYKPTKTILIMCTTIAAIPLISKRGNSDIEILGDTLMEFLETKGEVVGEFKRVFISANELFNKVKDRLQKDINFEKWLKTTKGNFLQSKINVLPDGLISFEYDDAKKSYCFRIRVSIPVPKMLH